MQKPPISDIFSLTKSVQILARIYGFWTFTINPNVRYFDIVRTCARNYICFALVLMVYTIAASIQIFAVISDVRNDVSPLTVGLVAVLTTTVGEIGFSLMSLVLDMCNRQFIWNIFISMHSFDNEVSWDRPSVIS